MSDAATVNRLPASETSTGIPSAKLGMWVFLASEVMFFAGLIGAYLVLRMGATEWPAPGALLNVPLTALNTFFLICSSVTMVLAYAAIHHRNDQRGLRNYLAATTAIGALFLGIQVFEYSKLIHHGLTISSSLFGNCFFTLTGFHGAHVFGGVVTMLIITLQAFRGRFSSDRHLAVEAAGLYWHFVDLVWIILFTIVYLL
ncbi:MAG: heme-copper oxidase subunit III [Candidatus Omnitrophica bacterium]|nr:heme-copper oxidase subunit III [Candidatus Omnitrophota bacterium]